MNQAKLEQLYSEGFVPVPENYRYVVNKQGVVWDTKRWCPLPMSLNNSGYLMGTLTGDDGVRRTYGLHRILALTFLQKNDWTPTLVVNHRNGDKLDNRLENLEWVTYRENAEHAGAHGLTDRCIPISARDVDTGEVTKYPSIACAAECLGMSKDAMNHRVRIGEHRVFPEKRQYRKGHGDEPWYIPINVVREMLANGTSKQVLCRWLRPWPHGTVKCFATQADLAAYLNVSGPTLTEWLKRPNQPVLPGHIQIKLLSDETPWRHVECGYRELYPHAVEAIHDESGEAQLFSTAKACADAMGIKPTALNYRLKSDGKTVFSDGFRYQYRFNKL